MGVAELWDILHDVQGESRQSNVIVEDSILDLDVIIVDCLPFVIYHCTRLLGQRTVEPYSTFDKSQYPQLMQKLLMALWSYLELGIDVVLVQDGRAPEWKTSKNFPSSWEPRKLTKELLSSGNAGNAVTVSESGCKLCVHHRYEPSLWWLHTELGRVWQEFGLHTASLEHGEADGLVALLSAEYSLQGYKAAVLSSDVDSLQFGAGTLLRLKKKTAVNTKSFTLYNNTSAYSRTMMILTAMFTGSDYCQGISKIGKVKAKKAVQTLYTALNSALPTAGNAIGDVSYKQVIDAWDGLVASDLPFIFTRKQLVSMWKDQVSLLAFASLYHSRATVSSCPRFSEDNSVNDSLTAFFKLIPTPTDVILTLYAYMKAPLCIDLRCLNHASKLYPYTSEKRLGILTHDNAAMKRVLSQFSAVNNPKIWPKLFKSLSLRNAKHENTGQVCMIPVDKEQTKTFRRLGRKHTTSELVNQFVSTPHRPAVTTFLESYDSKTSYTFSAVGTLEPVYVQELYLENSIQCLRVLVRNCIEATQLEFVVIDFPIFYAKTVFPNFMTKFFHQLEPQSMLKYLATPQKKSTTDPPVPERFYFPGSVSTPEQGLQDPDILQYVKVQNDELSSYNPFDDSALLLDSMTPVKVYFTDDRVVATDEIVEDDVDSDNLDIITIPTLDYDDFIVVEDDDTGDDDIIDLTKEFKLLAVQESKTSEIIALQPASQNESITSLNPLPFVARSSNLYNRRKKVTESS